jgi:translation initiation factor IF-2
LDLILLEAEMLELKANYDTLAKGTVIESSIDKRQGPIATIIVKKGTMKIGDPFVCGAAYGRVRSIQDERGQRLTKAEPSDPVVISDLIVCLNRPTSSLLFRTNATPAR